MGKAWIYLLSSLEQPSTLPQLLTSVAKGAHAGQLITLKPHRKWLRAARIETIIDVGANTGQFSSAMRALLPHAQIYAFEPLSECFAELSRRFERSGNFKAFMVALGDEPNESIMWRSEFSESSSLLKMTELHKKAFPWSADNTTRSVTVRALDTYLPELRLMPRVLLKLDVQGFEGRVLRGATRMLDRVDYVLTEVTFRSLYEGQASFDDIYQYLGAHGFDYRGNLDQLSSPIDGTILQADALFSRRP